MQNFMYGKAIELFLVNGSADSLTTAELSNWNGKAIKIPRTEISGCHREDIKGVGVYFLMCQEDDGTDSELMWVRLIGKEYCCDKETIRNAKGFPNRIY